MDHPHTFRAYAKVNLCLSVGAPEAGGPKAGFHPIASWMQCIELYDEVVVRRAPGQAESTYTIRWAADAPRQSPIDWAPEKDLCVRAHRALEALARESSGGALPVAMEVLKRIPVGGGLGGGSSDAAAVLRALVSAFELKIGEERIRELAMTLGSDVVFFADFEGTGGAARGALVTGFGDRVQRVSSVPGEMVLVVPPYRCPTGPVYKAFDEVLAERLVREAAERVARGNSGREKQAGPRESLVESRWKRMARAGRVEGDHLFNDLALAAFRVEPRLGRLVTALSNATREQAHVTGSGSCVFIPSTVERVGRVLERVQRLLASSDEFADVKAVRTRLL